MEVEGYPGLIKTIKDDEEVEDFSEESDVEEDVWFNFSIIYILHYKRHRKLPLSLALFSSFILKKYRFISRCVLSLTMSRI